VIRAANERTLDALDIAISGAWHGALFGKAEKLPDLGEVLGRMRRRRKQTPQETLARFDAWAAQVKAVTGVINERTR
jgi:hypothetical protein